MKKVTIIIALLLVAVTCEAQIPVVSLVSGIIKKVITALDLKVQQLQNQTIALQNAEKQLENNLHLNSLNDISGWLTKEKTLYEQYYQELARVRTIIADYDEVKRIISQQAQLVSEYKNASQLFNRDQHFSAQELNYIGQVYDGILQESVRNLDEVLMAVNAFSTQMSDAERLEAIHHATAGMQRNLDDLRRFNHNNIALSLQRSKNAQDRQAVKQWYGLN
jgi:hypothetical protein